MSDLYRFNSWYSYTPDIEIEKKEDKYGIVYLPTGETLLPFEYENIMINGSAVNNFFVVKNGLYGAVHLEGIRNQQCDLFAKRADLAPYNKKPALVCDVQCKYDYFSTLCCGEAVFYNNDENVYLYSGIENTVMSFDEISVDNYTVWAKKDNKLHLASTGEILYSEPFKGFRFTNTNLSFCTYIDRKNHDRLFMKNGRYVLLKNHNYLRCSKRKNLCFDGRIVGFDYYSKNYDLEYSKPAGIKVPIKLYGIREKSGVNITSPFAHTIEYVGKNRFIVNAMDGKFDLIEVECHGQVETEYGKENLYPICPKYLLKKYDYVFPLGKGDYAFIKEGENIVICNTNDADIQETP